MTPHIGNLGHDGSFLTSNSVQDDQKAESLIGVRYTQEELLMLRPVGNGDPDGKTNSDTIVRKEKLEEVGPDQSTDQPQIELQENDPDEEFQEETTEKKKNKKKKKKKKSSGKNKKPPPTGFEEFYADPPVTPDEYLEELYDIYHHSRSFDERIQLCIQRYRARRKLDEDRANYFNKYLTLGGIETGVKAFSGGLDKDTIDNSTAAEIAAIQATDYIRSGSGKLKFYDAGDPVNWVVDFEGVVKGFLSQKAPRIFGIEARKVKEYCGVIRNFINYVLTHSVCPEYTTNVIAARKICDLAEKELQLIKDVGSLMPGDFNMAASTLYGGYYQGLYVGSVTWSDEFNAIPPRIPDAHQKRNITGITIAEAERIFKTAIAFVGTWEHFEKMMENPPHVVKEDVRSMEVIDIILPNQDMRKKYGGTKDEHGQVGNIAPLGVLKVKHWDNPEADDEDVSDDGQEDSSNVNELTNSLTQSFWLEEHILEKCFIGMKFDATVRELNIGIKYFDSIRGIYCSFFTALPSDLLDGWKEPVPNPRPGPTVDDIDNTNDLSEGQHGDDFD